MIQPKKGKIYQLKSCVHFYAELERCTLLAGNSKLADGILESKSFVIFVGSSCEGYSKTQKWWMFKVICGEEIGYFRSYSDDWSSLMTLYEEAGDTP